jgi:gliding-associated putative ABC transporter substrate-binding component GldG
LLVTGILVLLNVVSIGVFQRLDLTHDRAFTLSAATKDTLKDLENPVKVTAYFTENLPPPFSENSRAVHDLLEEYRAASHGNLSFEFIDPQSQETDKDKETKKEVKRDIFGRAVREKTSVETELEGLGIQPVEVRVFEEDQAQTKRAYMGIVVRYGEDKQSIPVVQDMATLEYDLTSMILKMVRKKTPVVGVVQGHGEPGLERAEDGHDLAKFSQLLKPNYDVKPVNLASPVADDVDVLLVVGPQQGYSDTEQKTIDEFLMKGKSAAFFLDRTKIDFKTFQPTPNAENLDQLVSAYGIELGQQVVGDVDCASLNVQEKRGFMVISMPLKYPFIPMPKSLEGNSPMTKGIGDVTLPFPLPVYPKKDVAGLEIQSLAKSSSKSWLEDPSPENLNPRRDYGSAQIGFTGPYTLIAEARGSLPSFADNTKHSAKEARVIVAGTSALLDDQVMGPQNAALVLNMVDWLSLDSKLLEMRTRGQSEAAFKPELSDAARNAAKYGNVIGVPVLLAIVGLIRWRIRESKRARLSAGVVP